MVDYDKTDLPAAYDHARDHGPEMRELWMRSIAAHLEGFAIGRVLDLGCGTGRFSEALAARFGADVFGLDPSAKMLALAIGKRQDRRVHYHRGRAEAIPLRSGSVDIVFMSMSLHHFDDLPLAAHECRRVLRDDGRVFIRTGTRDQIEAYPYVPFFHSARPILHRVLPSRAGIRGSFEAAGFQAVAARSVDQTIAPDWTAYANKVAAGGDSVLAQLSRENFDDGMAALRRRAAIDGDHPVVEPIDLLVFR